MLIGLTGKKRSGKSTAAEYLKREQGFTELSFAQRLKDMALAINPLIDIGCYTYEIRSTGGLVLDRSVETPLYLDEAVGVLGWEDVKDTYPEARRFLQRLGTEGVRGHIGENTWVDIVEDQLDAMWETDYLSASDEELDSLGSGIYRPVVIADVRFPNEANMIRRNNGIVVEVRRDGLEEGDDHDSEKGVEFDHFIVNVEGELGFLHTQLDNLVGLLR